METWQHGGDIYRNEIEYDFSVNVNPLGMPDSVKEALHRAVEQCETYPDLTALALRKAIAQRDGVLPEQVLCGNGASELFVALMHGLHPRRIVILVPSFYGYEHAANACGADVLYVNLREEHAFMPDDTLWEALTPDVDLLMLAGPNNPVGTMLSDEQLRQICMHCRQRDIDVVFDQCFLDFVEETEEISGQKGQMCRWVEEFPNLFVVRAFTKIYAVPGVRIGYLFGTDNEKLAAIQRQLPEWNLSTFAQNAGVAACGECEYVAQTAKWIAQEREWMARELRKQGIVVYEGRANYLLLYTELPIYEPLRRQKILVRDCRNYRGLHPGYYRVAIRTHADNRMLMEQMERIRKQGRNVLPKQQ